jgi:hypothetical protein
LGSVVLASTFWDEVLIFKALYLELQLKTRELWGYMIDHGSEVFHQGMGKASALKIIQNLIDKRRLVTLDIQKEMEVGVRLDPIGTGHELLEQLAEQHARCERRMEKKCEKMKKIVAAQI